MRRQGAAVSAAAPLMLDDPDGAPRGARRLQGGGGIGAAPAIAWCPDFEPLANPLAYCFLGRFHGKSELHRKYACFYWTQTGMDFGLECRVYASKGA